MNLKQGISAVLVFILIASLSTGFAFAASDASDFAYFPLKGYDFIDAYNRSQHALGTLSRENNTLQVTGTNVKLIVLTWDKAQGSGTGARASWTIPDAAFNELDVRWVVYGTREFDAECFAAMALVGQTFAEIFDPDFDAADFVQNCDSSNLLKSVTLTYSRNGFDYSLSGTDFSLGDSPAYAYDFIITLSANQGRESRPAAESGQTVQAPAVSESRPTHDAGNPTQTGSCGWNMTWRYYASDGTLAIVGPGHMQDYKEDAQPWYAFREKIRTLELDPGLTSIGNNAFAGCSGLTSVTIPDSVTSIGYRAFFDCGGLETVTLGSGLQKIGESAFSSCTALSGITIPAGVTAIDNFAFAKCPSLTAYQVAAGNKSFRAVDGVLLTKDKKQLVSFPSGRTGAYAIPESVTAVVYGAFAWCEQLTEVTIPAGVKRIEAATFTRCSALTTVTLPVSVKLIDHDAFRDCDSLRDVNYGGSMLDFQKVAIGVRNDCLTNATWHNNAG